jgi:exopolysaccharide production protein ExoZ
VKQKLVSLQVLRAVAALFVVAAHAIYYVASRQTVPDGLQTLARSLGVFGVDIFFVISGFIMVYTSSDLFGTESGPKRFAYRRIVRIVPMYWLATTIEVALQSRHVFPSFDLILSSLFFIPAINDPGFPLRPILGVGWTLNHEMFFYALFTCALFLRKSLGIWSLISSLVAIVALGSFVKPLTDTSEPTTVLTFLCNPIILLFAAGVTLGVAIKEFAGHRLFHVPFAGTLSIAPIIISVALFVTVLDRASYMVDIDRAAWPVGWELVFWGLCVASVGFASVASSERRYASVAWLAKLGDASYSIYLFHFTVIAVVGRLWEAAFGQPTPLVFIGIAFTAATFVGLMIHLLVEQPLLESFRTSRNLSRTFRIAPKR